MAATKSAVRRDRTLVRARRPPADAAIATTSKAALGCGHHTSTGVWLGAGDTAAELPAALYHMDEGPLSAATYTVNRAFASRALKLDETFIRVAATRLESKMLRAAAAQQLRAESIKLRLTAAELSSQSTRLKAKHQIGADFA